MFHSISECEISDLEVIFQQVTFHWNFHPFFRQDIQKYTYVVG